MASEELNAVETEVKREAGEDADLRSQYNHRWTRPASVALNSQITEKIAGRLSTGVLDSNAQLLCQISRGSMQEKRQQEEDGFLIRVFDQQTPGGNSRSISRQPANRRRRWRRFGR